MDDSGPCPHSAHFQSQSCLRKWQLGKSILLKSMNIHITRAIQWCNQYKYDRNLSASLFYNFLSVSDTRVHRLFYCVYCLLFTFVLLLHAVDVKVKTIFYIRCVELSCICKYEFSKSNLSTYFIVVICKCRNAGCHKLSLSSNINKHVYKPTFFPRTYGMERSRRPYGESNKMTAF